MKRQKKLSNEQERPTKSVLVAIEVNKQTKMLLCALQRLLNNVRRRIRVCLLAIGPDGKDFFFKSVDTASADKKRIATTFELLYASYQRRYGSEKSLISEPCDSASALMGAIAALDYVMKDVPKNDKYGVFFLASPKKWYLSDDTLPLIPKSRISVFVPCEEQKKDFDLVYGKYLPTYVYHQKALDSQQPAIVPLYALLSASFFFAGTYTLYNHPDGMSALQPLYLDQIKAEARSGMETSPQLWNDFDEDDMIKIFEELDIEDEEE